MKINKINIHKGGIGNFAESIEQNNYHSDLSIGESDFQVIKKGLKELNKEQLTRVQDNLNEIELESSLAEKKDLQNDLKSFLISCGIAINQNIAASVIFETLKNFF